MEVAVQVVERWVLAKLRHRRFFSLGELNAAIGELIDELNSRTMRRIGSSRRALFEVIERPALQSLPTEPFEYAEWKRCRSGLDYHIEVQGHWYPVPHRLIREVVEVRITDRTVEVFHHGVRVAVHVRSPMRHRHTTVPDHMPSAHRRYADWTPAKLRREAARIGPAAAHLVELILSAKPHPAVVDNYATHTHPKVNAWLVRHPRWTFHFTPTSGSWINAVETFFSAMTRQRIRRGSSHSIVSLQAVINEYVANRNAKPRPFVWTASAASILAKLARLPVASE